MSKYKILQGDVRQTLAMIQDKTIQCVVTSPPYYGLRDYGVDGQIGLEQTPDEYVQQLVNVFREVRRVMKDDGTLWLNLGDSYAGSGGAGGDYSTGGFKDGQPKWKSNLDVKISGLKPKDLIGIPWRVAFALQADGWYLRQDIIWHKPNPMPESVKDRCTKAHEYIFLLTKSAQYYYDNVAIMEPVAESSINRANYGWDTDHPSAGKDGVHTEQMGLRFVNPAGRNKRSVWTVTTKSYTGAHFATFPMDLIEPCILAGTSEKGECPNCGKAWVRDVDRIPMEKEMSERTEYKLKNGMNTAVGGKMINPPQAITKDWMPQCKCNKNPIPSKVLDPFNGSGTTGFVAMRKDRDYIGCELNPSYIQLTKERFAELGMFINEDMQ